ncbi:competence protein ComEA [Paenibacillus endophyticus]|uniref:Competence protein ComEA n=1 Tax=Paenibacillus endophyticus TaxID=1294268 RepID=A0A7W5C4S3_9BACL|nr:helix-hairpin-helix domain-containing protein [Paenibacillus endophyticus]MBB3151158.1 competence protein ComEA [Paenibacillus endophyticus]
MMKSGASLLSNKRLLLASVLIVTAVILLCASLIEPKRTAAGEWLPLNEEVANALSELDNKDERHIEIAADAVSEPYKKEPDPSGNASGQTEPTGVEKAVTDSTDDAEPKGNNNNLSLGKSGNDEDADKLDINRASASELDALKGIGPAKAEAIVEDRQKNGKFTSIEDLLRVKGIGEKLLHAMEDSIVARP